MQQSPYELTFAVLAVACALIGSFHDVRERRIPNLLTGPSILLALICHGCLEGWAGLGGSFAAGLLAGGATIFFFLAGGMGAGDVKLMAAAGCFLGLHLLPALLLATAFCGAAAALFVAWRHDRLPVVVANAFAVLRHHREHGMKPHPELHVNSHFALRLPFAVPITGGCIVAAVLQFRAA